MFGDIILECTHVFSWYDTTISYRCLFTPEVVSQHQIMVCYMVGTVQPLPLFGWGAWTVLQFTFERCLHNTISPLWREKISQFLTLSAFKRQCALVIEKVSHLSTVPPWIINIEYTGAPLRFKGRRRRGEGEREDVAFNKLVVCSTSWLSAWFNQMKTYRESRG